MARQIARGAAKHVQKCEFGGGIYTIWHRDSFARAEFH